MKSPLKNLILLVFVLGNISAQSIPRDTVFAYEGSKYIFNDSEVFYFKPRGLSYNMIVDSSIVARNINRFSIDFYHYDSKTQTLFFCQNTGSNNILHALSLTQKTLTNIEDFKNSTIKYMEGEFIYSYSGDEINVFDLANKKTIKQASLSEMLDYDGIGIFELIANPNNSNLLVGEGAFEDGAILGTEYHLISKNDLSPVHSSELGKSSNNFSSFYNGKIPVKLVGYDIQRNYTLIDTVILNNDYEIFSGYLKLGLNINGFIIDNNSLNAILVRSKIDPFLEAGFEEVIIQYTPSAMLEKCIYQIYYDIKLSKDDLKSFDNFDLGILENMVFAKHNLQFEDVFLNAYFNLYEFYRRAQKTRIRDINAQLTENDLVNLKLIRSVIQ